MRRKRINWHDQITLKVGGFYLWTGVVENLYTVYRWKRVLCRVTKIKKRNVTLFDFGDMKKYTYSTDNCSTHFDSVWSIFKRR